MNGFAEVARAALRDSGYSMTAAARAINYDLAYLSRVLNGKQGPSPRLAHALDKLVGAGGTLADVALNAEEASRVGHAVARPSRLDAATVTALGDVLAAQRRLEDRIGAGPLSAPTLAQLENVALLAKEGRGPQRSAMLAVAAEWHQYAGWLHASVRSDSEALRLLSMAEDLSDEAGDGIVAAVAVSFKGYVARQRGNYRGVVRASYAALNTPGGHPAQQAFDTLQAATGHAGLGDRERARRLLGEAAEASTRIGEPPGILYWYSPEFFQMNIGMVSLSLGDQRMAAACLDEGLRGLPTEQQGADWTQEYRSALREAAEGR